MDIGWTQANVEVYAKGHYHLVNQQTANMVKDNEPDVQELGDQEWLASHPAVAGSGKAPRMQIYKRNKKISKVSRVTHKMNAISEAGERNSTDS